MEDLGSHTKGEEGRPCHPVLLVALRDGGGVRGGGGRPPHGAEVGSWGDRAREILAYAHLPEDFCLSSDVLLEV